MVLEWHERCCHCREEDHVHFLLHKVTYSVALAALPCSTCAPGRNQEAPPAKAIQSPQTLRDSELLVRTSSQVKPSRAEGSVDSAQNARAKMMADSMDAFFFRDFRNPTCDEDTTPPP